MKRRAGILFRRALKRVLAPFRFRHKRRIARARLVAEMGHWFT